MSLVSGLDVGTGEWIIVGGSDCSDIFCSAAVSFVLIPLVEEGLKMQYRYSGCLRFLKKITEYIKKEFPKKGRRLYNDGVLWPRPQSAPFLLVVAGTPRLKVMLEAHNL